MPEQVIGITLPPYVGLCGVSTKPLTEIPDWDRIFRPGTEIREYPVSKWEHATRLTDGLAAIHADYREGLGEETVPDISDDGRTIRFTARISEPAPMKELSLLLGDTLHNYRSALDGLAWELAHLDGRRVATQHERQFYFPLALTEERWETMKRTTLSSMPEIVLHRLQTVQPYRFDAAREGIGLLLNRMNNDDKHRAGLTLELRVVDKTAFTVDFRMREPSGSPSTNDSYDFVAPPRTILDGDEVFIFRSIEPVESAQIAKIPLVLGVEIDGRWHDVFWLLSLIERQVAGTFINACVGVTPGDWVEFIMNGTPRPDSPWFPNVGRFTPDMRDAALSEAAHVYSGERPAE